MSSKRRRLNPAVETPSLSAFAARSLRLNRTQTKQDELNSQRQGVYERPAATVQNHAPGTPHLESEHPNTEGSDIASSEGQAGPSGFVRNGASTEDIDDATDTESPAQSRDSSPQIPIARSPVLLSTVTPSKTCLKDFGKLGVNVRIAPGERLVVFGQYELQVEKGRVSILGYTICASKRSYPVFASASHALPVIRCPADELDEALIRLTPMWSGIELLKPLSPLFSGLWNDGPPLGSTYAPLLKYQDLKSSYRILHTSDDLPYKIYVQPIISPPEWNELISRLSSLDIARNAVVFICGPKNAGKSTFARILINRLLSVGEENRSESISRSHSLQGVALLDLDPGQPEYSTPGQLSLTYVEEPNFGPPFTHPLTTGKVRTLRAHASGALTPAADPCHYISCALDLFEHYRSFLSQVPKCPVIINTPGWILGTGLELLLELITKIRPTEVVYMSKEGPSEVVQSLQEASGTIPFYTLPSQPSEYAIRTSAQLRTMQYMSYFHLLQSDNKLAWNGQPLTSIPPLEIRYEGDDPGILGIMCYGEQPPPDLLADTINGSLLAVVVLDDAEAMPRWDSKAMSEHYETSENTSQSLRGYHTTRTREALPYLNPITQTLDPRHSHSLGLLLVRGIDVRRRRLQVLTPIPVSVIEEVLEAKKAIVLVSGKLDTPGWAYLEGLGMRGKNHNEKAMREGAEDMMEVDQADDMDEAAEENGGESDAKNDTELLSVYEDGGIPWVEKLSGSQGRGAGAKVWRVRRDLGKTRESI